MKKVLTFNLNILKSSYIYDPIAKEDFTFEKLFNYAQVIAEKELNNFKKNQRILLISNNVYYIVSFIIACWKRNIIPSIVSPNLNKEDYLNITNKIKFDSIITYSETISESLGFKLIEPVSSDQKIVSKPIDLKFELEQIAIVLFSSGSSGEQKAIPLSFSNLLTNITSFKSTLEITEKVSFLCTSPVWHAHGLYNSLLTALFLHKKVIYSGILNIFNANKLLESSKKEPELVYHVTPSMLSILSSAADRMASSKLPRFYKIICGTSFLDYKAKLDFEQKFDTELIQQYGMTEALFISLNDKPKTKPRSVGKPLSIVDLSIWDKHTLKEYQEGQIRIKSPSFFGCYFDQDLKEQISLNDFFFTGDLGYIDEDGYLFITGRKKDIIKKGGLSVSPKKINKIIEEFDGVNEAYTLSKVDQKVGEEIFSFITATKKIHLTNLRDYLKTKLSVNLLPKEIFQIKKFPLNEMGKINKSSLYNILKEKNV